MFTHAVTTPSPPSKTLLSAAFAARVALCRARLGRSGLAQLGRAASWVLTLVVLGLALASRLGDGLPLDVSGLLLSAGDFAFWLVGLPIAMSAAMDVTAADRKDGIAALVSSRGAPVESLTVARLVASMTSIGVALLPPVTVVALVALVTMRPGEGAIRLVFGLVSAFLFALAGGVTLGTASSLAERMGGKRGRSVLLALVFLPLIAADFVGRPGLSIPGALHATLDVVSSVGGGST